MTYKQLLEASKKLFDQFEGDIKIISNTLILFLQKHNEKILNTSKIVQLWNGKNNDFATAEKIINDLPKINKELISLLNELAKHEIQDITLLTKFLDQYSIISKTSYSNNYNVTLDGVEKEMTSIKDQIAQLIQLINTQNETLKNHTTWKTANELQNHIGVYLMLNDEIKISDRIKNSILNINCYLKKLPMKIEKKDKTLNYEEILPFGISQTFRKMYDNIYVKLFPDPEEREELEKFMHYLKKRYNVDKNKAVSHIIAIKSGSEVVGGAIFDFICCESGFSFCFCWFIFLTEDYRKEGFPFIIKSIERILLTNEKVMKSPLKFLLCEVNDATKMTPQQIEEDSVPPKVRERLYRIMGLRKIKFNYVQPILPPATQPVTYLALYTHIVDNTFKKEIPAIMLKEAMYRTLQVGFDRDPNKDPYYIQMAKELDGMQKIELL